MEWPMMEDEHDSAAISGLSSIVPYSALFSPPTQPFVLQGVTEEEELPRGWVEVGLYDCSLRMHPVSMAASALENWIRSDILDLGQSFQVRRAAL